MTTRQLITTAIFGFLIFIFSVLFWSGIPAFFIDPLNIVQAAIPLLLLICLFSFITTYASLSSSLFSALIIFSFSIIPIPFTLVSLALPLLTIFGVLSGVFLTEIFYFYRVNSDKHLYTRPNILRTAGANLGLLFLLFSFILSTGYYVYAKESTIIHSISIPEQLIDWSASNALKLISLNQPEAANLPQDVLNEFVLSPLKNALRVQLQTLLDQYRAYLAPILATSLFFSLMALGIVVKSMTILLSSLIIFALRVLGLVSVRKQMQEVEIFEFS